MEQMSRELALLRSQVTPDMEVDLSSEPSLTPDSPQDASRELHRGRDPSAERSSLRGAVRSQFDSSVRGGHSATGDAGDPFGSSGWLSDVSSPHEFRLHQDLKPGQAQMVAQAWSQHEQDRKKVSKSPRQVKELLIADHEQPFELRLPDDKISAGFWLSEEATRWMEFPFG